MNNLWIQLNKYYKYKELCEIFGVKPATGNTKIKQIKEWERYGKLVKGEKATFMFVELYDVPKDKVDNRKGNSGKSEGSRGNRSLYAEYIDKLILNMVIENNYCLEASTGDIFIENPYSNISLDLLTEDYNNISFDRNELNSINAKIIHELPEWIINSYMDKIYLKLNTIIRSSLDRLQKQEYVNYTEDWYCIDQKYNYWQLANDKQIVEIEKSRQYAFDMLEITNKDLFKKELRNKHKKLSLEWLKGNEKKNIKQHSEVYGYRKVFNIKATSKLTKDNRLNENDYNEYKNKLKKLLMNFMHEWLENKTMNNKDTGKEFKLFRDSKRYRVMIILLEKIIWNWKGIENWYDNDNTKHLSWAICLIDMRGKKLDWDMVEDIGLTDTCRKLSEIFGIGNFSDNIKDKLTECMISDDFEDLNRDTIDYISNMDLYSDNNRVIYDLDGDEIGIPF